MKFQNPVSFDREKKVHVDSTVMRDRKYTPHSELKYDMEKKKINSNEKCMLKVLG